VRRQSPTLVAEVGGAAAGTSPYERAKFEAILRGESALGVAAHNVGASESALGADYLRGVSEDTRVPLVSCNVQDVAGRPFAPPVRIVKAGGRRIALTGVLSPSLAPAAARVTDPRRAVSQTLAAIKGQFDLSIVLAYLPENELRRLAAELPEVDLVVGGPTGQSLPVQRHGPTTLVAVTNKGKFVAQLTLDPERREAGLRGELVELGERWENDAGQLANLNDFYARLAAADFAPADTDFMAVTAVAADHRKIAGTRTCRECHTRDCQEWDESKHARAWKTLVAKSAHVDSYCQQCHTTGYGVAGGFGSLEHAPQHGGIGCESCHGPSQQHANNPTAHTPYAARDQCLHCHDQENSPSFEYASYWQRIEHGYPATAQNATTAPITAAVTAPNRAPTQSIRFEEDDVP
jgi:hypothetical protein